SEPFGGPRPSCAGAPIISQKPVVRPLLRFQVPHLPLGRFQLLMVNAAVSMKARPWILPVAGEPDEESGERRQSNEQCSHGLGYYGHCSSLKTRSPHLQSPGG